MTMRLGIVADFTDRASKRMAKLLRANKKLEKANKAQGKLAKQQAAQTKAQTAAQGKFASQVERSSRLMSVLKATASGVASGIGAASAAMLRFTGTISRAIRRIFSLKAALSRVSKGVDMMKTGAGKIARGVMVAGGLALGATALAGGAANAVIGPAAQMEKYQTILETTTGSAAKAKEAMAWVTDFAVRTPYELQDVMGSFVQLRNYGLEPTNGLLKTLGDTSAAMGKPIMQAVEAMADAVTGENERLKEFGIKARKAGKYFYYEYTQNGVTKVAKALASDRAAIQKTLSGIFDAKYSGAMEKLSQTWEGMLSNLSDMWFKFRLMIAESGLFDFAKEKLRGLLDLINKMEADGSLKVWAKEIGDNIIATLQAAWTFGLQLFDIIKQVGSWLKFAADALGGWNRLVGVFIALPLLGTIAGIITGFAQLAAGLMLVGSGIAALSLPVMAIIAGVAAVASAAYLIYDNWDGIVDWFSSLWTGIVDYASAAWDWFKTNMSWHPLALIANNWGEISAWFSAFWDRLKNTADMGWQAVKTLFDWSPLGLIINNWSEITQWVGSFWDDLKVRVSAGWETIKSTFTVDWASLLSTGLPEAVQRIIDTFSNINLFHVGVKILKSLWDGMLSLVDQMVSSISSKLSSMMPTLPSWLGGGKTEAVQQRASGGAFNRGPLLVGEKGPELSYANRSGFIAHHDQLQQMAALSDRIRQGTATAALAASVATASPAIAASAPVAASPSVSALHASGNTSGASTAQSGHTFHIQFSPTVTVGEGASISREEIMDLLNEQADELVDLVKRKMDEDGRLDF
ncbi:hypothetical protein SAMN04515647_1677 [Cohaesibacter sp. ES.047]|uniref:tape measure protein n=1 Tax=Cohaesibacter sp. ES.047 TaxID=1798205 RepID=UPI000BB7C6C6|nr:tape measure protein [Cohaesibacter sp. ES.047]SNY91456.1 hypothetical protein SAMN04515647_1677 [Cohaesibacter sp. ES.047]